MYGPYDSYGPMNYGYDDHDDSIYYDAKDGPLELNVDVYLDKK
jgi:hypothetical protein